MGLMLDADVVIANERGVFDLETWLSTQTQEPVFLAAITVAELLHGLERARASHRARREAYLTQIMGACEVLDYGAPTVAVHARIWAELESAGQIAGAHDLIVAATALEHDHVVATFNTRHFQNVKGLRLIQP
jgi:tRNA(fMet)-specific endonuclease VapC